MKFDALKPFISIDNAKLSDEDDRDLKVKIEVGLTEKEPNHLEVKKSKAFFNFEPDQVENAKIKKSESRLIIEGDQLEMKINVKMKLKSNTNISCKKTVEDANLNEKPIAHESFTQDQIKFAVIWNLQYFVPCKTLI